MSEGPEVKIVADKIQQALGKKSIEGIIINNLEENIKDKIIGSSLDYANTYGKNLILRFSSGIYLRSHMLMWGKWRIYNRVEYEAGLAKLPPRRQNLKNSNIQDNSPKDVRSDSRTRLTIITSDKVLVEFNGPILQFSTENPVFAEPIKSLGPDALAETFNAIEVKKRLKNKEKNNNLLLVDALLDQRIVSGIGNKYKSEILFSTKLYPFKKISELSKNEIFNLVEKIPMVLNFGYKNKGRTRVISLDENKSWNNRHWVFRRSGKNCFICGTKIQSEKIYSKRITFWCPNCQK